MDQQAKSPDHGDDLVRQAILIRLEFCHNVINYAIAFAGLVIAGFAGLLASGLFFAREAASLLLLFSGLVFHLLHLILTHEEWLMTGMNRELSRSVPLYPGPWGIWYDPKFVFLALLAVGALVFTVLYLGEVEALGWLLRPIFLVLLILNVVALLLGFWMRGRLLRRVKEGGQ